MSEAEASTSKSNGAEICGAGEMEKRLRVLAVRESAGCSSSEILYEYLVSRYGSSTTTWESAMDLCNESTVDAVTDFWVSHVLPALHVPFADVAGRRFSADVENNRAVVPNLKSVQTAIRDNSGVPDPRPPKTTSTHIQLHPEPTDKQVSIDLYNDILDFSSRDGPDCPPIVLINEVLNDFNSFESLPFEFQYITSLQIPGLQAQDNSCAALDSDVVLRSYKQSAAKMPHCACTDSCSSADCSCKPAYRETMLNITVFENWQNLMQRNANSREMYRTFKTLAPRYMQKSSNCGSDIIECNPETCRCNAEKCLNTLVQHGRTVALALFRTGLDGTTDRRLGVKALHDLPKGAFITEYVGELISDAELQRRIFEGSTVQYAMVLPYEPDCMEQEIILDAGRKGNVSRFINNSCEPNLISFNVYYKTYDCSVPHVALFTNRFVKAGEELTYQYGLKPADQAQTCRCGSTKCKGRF